MSFQFIQNLPLPSKSVEPREIDKLGPQAKEELLDEFWDLQSQQI